MKRDYPHLCAPLTVGRLTLRNRMLSAPMGATDITAEGTPGPRTQGFYELRAKGGAAVVTVSELVVHPKTDGSQMLRLSLKTPGQLGAFTYLADAIKRHGAVASIELSHSGQYAGTYMVDKEKKGDLCQWGPSDGVRPDGMPVRALSHEQIASIVAAYGEAAALAKRAGFQMVMVHAGHGWLINQFLSPYFNKREDEYGGPLENRIRFAREVLASVRSAVGPGFPIELRISGAELFEGGYDVEEGARIAHALEDLVDLMHVSAGSYQFGFSITHPSMFRDHGCNVHLAAEIKKHVSIPVVAIGGLSDPAQMETLNRIVFTHVRRAVETIRSREKSAGTALLAIDAINLFQSGLAELCGTTVGVLAPEEVRLRRIMRRDGIERQYALLRIRAQEPDGFYTARCAHILQNGEISPEEFQIQANALLENFPERLEELIPLTT